VQVAGAADFVVLSTAIIFFPQTANAQGVEVFESLDVRFDNIRAGACDLTNPTVGVVTSSTPDSALVFGNPIASNCVPVVGTNGAQMTLGEFKAPHGTAKVKCTYQGTLVNVHMSGLQPGGVYAVWAFVDVASPSSTLAGTALGSIVGDETFRNVFRASASGEGQLTLIQPGGEGTILGQIPECLLDIPVPNRVVRLLIAYHIDGTTGGPVPGPRTNWFGQERILLF
jgi:hypothetical protein